MLTNMSGPRTLIRAGWVMDAQGSRTGRPGAILVEADRVLATTGSEGLGPVADARIIDLPDRVVLPALVNAHCHLDLSHLDPAPYTGDFADWLDGIRTRRAVGDEAVADAVRRGIGLSRAGGIGVVGDIAGQGSEIPARELRAAGLRGVSYLELIGVGASGDRARATLRQASEWSSPTGNGLCLGLSPHAPYTCGLDLYRSAVELKVPIATHLAETPGELESVDQLAEVLALRPIVAAHVNYAGDQHLELLARTRTTVVFCPRAAAYFHHTSHRYRRMIEAGINVALGTDGLLCLDTPDRISVLDDMRLLYRRDGVDPLTLLSMATVAGARGLGLDPDLVTLAPGPVAGLIALPFDPADGRDPLVQILERDDAPEWVIR